MIDGPINVLCVRREPGEGWVTDDQNMSLLHCMGFSAAALVIFAGPKIAPRGYLAKTGPAPLRYKPPAIAPELVIPLPPLAMTNEVEKVSETIVTNAPPAEPVELPQPTPSTNALPFAVPVRIDDPFTPRMFVQFFNQGSTNAPVSVIAPVPFSPPSASIPAPPSSATYQVK